MQAWLRIFCIHFVAPTPFVLFPETVSKWFNDESVVEFSVFNV